MKQEKGQTKSGDEMAPNVVTAEDLPEIKCYECHIVFRSKEELEEHIADVHSEPNGRGPGVMNESQATQ